MLARGLGCLLLAAAALPAQGPATHFLIVGGLGGEPDYEQRFATYVRELEQICRTFAGDASRVTALAGKTASRAAIQAALEKLARAVGPSDALAVFLVGHGAFDGKDYKFNVPGPDMTAEELGALLDKVPAKRQLVVNMTSSSGVCAEKLARGDRVVVTATRSGTERNATVFARYWVEALRDPVADTDKNESISALEAFKYTEDKVKRFYSDQKRLATEHPRLEGKLASSFVLARMGGAAAAAADPARRKLLAQRESIEQQIDSLKLRKAAMPTEQYKKELEHLLLELARVQEALEQGTADERR
jgi:hypothetical protein